MKANPQQAWNLGYILLLISPFVGLSAALFDAPWWYNLGVAVVIVILVYAGTRLLFRTKGGWRPSQTLPEPGRNDEH